MGMVRLSGAFIRLIVWFVVSPVGRISAGVLCIIGGLIYGLTSHSVIYQQAPHGKYQVFIVDNGAEYLQFPGSKAYYIVTTVDLTPYPDPATFQGQTITSLVYTTAPQQVDVTTLDGIHLSGTGYAVVQFAYGNASGQTQQAFATADYTQHPDGFYDNHWLWGGPIVGVGLLFLLVTLLVPRILDGIEKRKERDSSAAIYP